MSSKESEDSEKQRKLEEKKKEDYNRLLANTEEQDKINCVFDEYEH